RAETFTSRYGTAYKIYPSSAEAVVQELEMSLRSEAARKGPNEAVATSSLVASDVVAIQAVLKASRLKIVFVEGDETQEQYRERVERDLASIYGSEVGIVWFGGWGSNWNTTSDAVDRELTDSSAIVVMP